MFKKLLLAASVLVMAALVLVMFVGCVSAGTVIYDDTFTFSGTRSFNYHFTSGFGSTFPNYCITGMYFKTPANFVGISSISVIYDGNQVTQWDGNSKYIDAELQDYGTSAVLGTCTHGYSKTASGDLLYTIDFNDDFTLGSSQTVKLVPYLTNLKMTMTACSASAVGATQFVLGRMESTQGYIAYKTGTTEPSHTYYYTKSTNFKNRYYVESQDDGIYTFNVWKQNIPGWSGDVAAKWKVWDAEVNYIQESGFGTANITSYCSMSQESFCDVLNINVWLPGDVGTPTFSKVLNDVCDYTPGYFDLSGHTRSVYGNIVPAVLVSARGESDYSSETGFYEFSDFLTGALTLDANKTGYYNNSESMYIGSAGSFQHDIYLIPVDALEEGEFGGVVYDYCSLQPISGAYVYLFNETADSGKYAYSNKYGFYRFAGMAEGWDYEVSASKDGYDASIVHSFTFNESNVNETHRKTKNIWLLPEDGCPEDGGIPTPPPAPTPTPHEWTNEEIVSWLRVNLMGLFIIVLIVTFLWFLRKAGGSKR